MIPARGHRSLPTPLALRQDRSAAREALAHRGAEKPPDDRPSARGKARFRRLPGSPERPSPRPARPTPQEHYDRSERPASAQAGQSTGFAGARAQNRCATRLRSEARRVGDRPRSAGPARLGGRGRAPD